MKDRSTNAYLFLSELDLETSDELIYEITSNTSKSFTMIVKFETEYWLSPAHNFELIESILQSLYSKVYIAAVSKMNYFLNTNVIFEKWCNYDVHSSLPVEARIYESKCRYYLNHIIWQKFTLRHLTIPSLSWILCLQQNITLQSVVHSIIYIMVTKFF